MSTLYTTPPAYQPVADNAAQHHWGRHDHNDRTALLGGDAPSKPFLEGHKRLILIFILATLVGYMYARGNQNLDGSLYDPKERQRIRSNWEQEKRQVQQDLDDLRERQHNEINQFQDTLFKLRQEQQHETDEHYFTLDRIRREQEREIQQHSATMKRLNLDREALQRQWHSDHIQLVKLRRDIESEEEQIKERRKELLEERRQWEEERQKREAEDRERQRQLIKWGPILPDDEPCVKYGIARYQAPLEYAPISWDPYTACMDTPIRIHQKDVLPTECRHIGGQMMGIWYIANESSCKPWWGQTKDYGCVGRQSGIHRYEASLEGYLDSDKLKSNWAEMCNTTPQIMFGQTYDSPNECAYSPRLGVYGLWDISDNNCN